jgi:APA family basic amino acid/polyamine antiporter
MPFVPLAGAASCLYLMAQLPAVTWLRFAGWLVLGLAIYFLYSRRSSALAADATD